MLGSKLKFETVNPVTLLWVWKEWGVHFEPVVERIYNNTFSSKTEEGTEVQCIPFRG